MKRDHSLCLETEKTYFSTMIVLEEGPTLLSVVWYVNFLRLWKYLYDQSMWMFRIALCCLLICFSTTHKRFQHQISIFSKNCFQIFWILVCLIFDVYIQITLHFAENYSINDLSTNYASNETHRWFLYSPFFG